MVVHFYIFPCRTAALLGSLLNQAFGAVSTIFFVLAGYFACRSVSWKKALDYAWWCFAPFVLWNGLCIALWSFAGKIPDGTSLRALWGLNHVFVSPGYPGIGTGSPLDAPLWFMRDLSVLFLFSPVFFRWARWLFPLLVLLSFAPSLAEYFSCRNHYAFLSPYAISFFVGGCFLRSLSEEFQRKVLEFHSIWVVLLIAALDALVLWRTGGKLPFWMSALMLWLLYQVARMIELYVPRSAAFALKFAPVTFLTFAGHWIVWQWLPFSSTRFVFMYPVLAFGAAALFFFTLKRWAPCLLHLVAHYKLRPEDLARIEQRKLR